MRSLNAVEKDVGVRVIIHPGYPKTGSTFLQQRVFANLDHVFLCCPEFPGYELSGREDISSLLAHFSGQSQLREGEAKELWEKISSEARNADSNCIVISNENFLVNHAPPASVVENLKSIIPGAQVLLVLRRQVDLLRSEYDMDPTISSAGKKQYVEFDGWIDRQLQAPDTNILGALRFADVHKLYSDAYGSENVLAVEFSEILSTQSTQQNVAEWLKFDPARFSSLFRNAKTNSSTRYRIHRFARKVLGDFHLSDVVPAKYLDGLLSRLELLVARGETTPSPEIEGRIEQLFWGQTVYDVVATNCVDADESRSIRND
jgi:hypothetical protein